MASGGTGDVLTGTLGGLLAQRLDPLDATLLAVYLHGLAGDLALARLGSPSLAAEDLVAALPAAFAALLGDGGPLAPGRAGHDPETAATAVARTALGVGHGPGPFVDAG
jgi:hypothetical protein